MLKPILRTMQLLVLAMGLVVSTAAPGLAAKPIAVTEAQAASINAISDYINSIKILTGEFTQISPRGTMSRGVFVISRPGKMRFEYAPPNPYLIVADGKWLTIKDTKREKGDQVPLCETPLRYLLCEDANLLNGTNVLDFVESGGLVSVTLEESKGLFNGNITLVYDKEKKLLQQWVIVDGRGKRTSVSLENVQVAVKTDPKLFVVKIERKEKDSK